MTQREMQFIQELPLKLYKIYRMGHINGVKHAAGMADTLDPNSPYRAGDLILAKFNLRKLIRRKKQLSLATKKKV